MQVSQVMRRAALLLVALALSSGACGGESSEVADQPSTPAPSEPSPAFQQKTVSHEAPILEPPAIVPCGRLSDEASAIVTQAERSVPQCETAADCRAFQIADLERCWSVCGDIGFGSPALERAVREARQSQEVRNTCAEFRELGCQIQEPGCPVSSPLPANFVGYECKSQRCEAVFQ